MNYNEAFTKDNNLLYVVDYDAYAFNVDAKDYLCLSDSLHKMIKDQFEKLINEPVRDFLEKVE